MADWYVSSANYNAVPQWAASTAYTVGQFVRPLAAPAYYANYVYRCTVAGTTAGTEPGWPAGNNATVTSGGATFTNVTGQSTYGWSAAAGNLFTLSNGAGNRTVNGDRVFLASDHAETWSAFVDMAWGSSGAYALIQIISVNRAGSVPPVAADVQAGASITDTNNTLSLQSVCSIFYQGITFNTGNSNLRFNGASFVGHNAYFKDCLLIVNGLTWLEGCKVTFDNTALQFANVASYIGGGSSERCDLLWINTPNAIRGGIIPTQLFKLFYTDGSTYVTMRGVDLSALTTKLLVGGTNWVGRILLDSCRIAPGLTRFVGDTNYGFNGDVELVNCYDGTNVINERWSDLGNVTVDRGATLNNGAQDDISNYSLKLTKTLGTTDFIVSMVECFPFDVENIATGVSKTATVEVASAGSLSNTDIRLMLEYMGGSLNTTTWNPADATLILSNGNLTATSNNFNQGTRGITSFTSGKFYFEVTMTNANDTSQGIGIGLASSSLSSIGSGGQAIMTSGSIWVNGGVGPSVGAWTPGTLVCIAVDLTAKLIWMRKGPTGNWNNSGTANPATGAGGLDISSISTGPLFPLYQVQANASATCTANFGASAFLGNVPSGFTAGWGTLNAANPLASFVDSLPTVLTPVAALPSSGNPWTFNPVTTWNPNDTNNPSFITYSNGNLTVTASNGVVGTRATIGGTGGKVYWEQKINANGGGTYDAVGVGLGSSGLSFTGNSTGQALVVNSGSIVVNNAAVTGNPALGALGTNTVGIALDFGAKLIWFRYAPSGNWNGSGAANPATGVGGVDISSIVTGQPLFPLAILYGTGGDSQTANFGASAFVGAVPAGFASGFFPTPIKQQLQVPFTPQRAGRVRGLVRLNKPSSTVWVNPQIAIA